MPDSFAFIDVPRASATERERNLARSLARSHAARNAHSKKQPSKSKTGRCHQALLNLPQHNSAECPTCSSTFAQEDGEHHRRRRSLSTEVNSSREDNDEGTHIHLEAPGAYVPSTYVSLTRLPGINVLDPFSTTPVTVRPNEHSILQYYLRFGWPSAHRAESMARGAPSQALISYPHIEDTVRLSLTDATLLYALLAKAAARLSQMDIQHQPYKRQASEYMARATGRLSQELNSPNSQSVSRLIMVICWLTIAEWNRGCHEEATIHMNALAHLLHQQPDTALGSTIDDAYTLDMINSYDTYMAAETDSTPKLPMPPRIPPLGPHKYAEVNARIDHILNQTEVSFMSIGTKHSDPATMEDQILHRSRPLLLDPTLSPSALDAQIKPLFIRAARARFGRGFLELTNIDDFLCDEFKAFFSDLVPQWPDMLLLCFADLEDVASEDAEWMAKRATQALRELLMLRQFTKSDPRQEALRLTLMAILNDLTSPVPWRAVAATLKRLKLALQSLEGIMESFEEAYHPSTLFGSLMLWVLSIALCATSTDKGVSSSTEDIEWWESRAMELASQMSISTIPQIYAIMAKYLFCGVVRHPRLVGLMERITAFRTQNRKLDFRASTVPG